MITSGITGDPGPIDRCEEAFAAIARTEALKDVQAKIKTGGKHR